MTGTAQPRGRHAIVLAAGHGSRLRSAEPVKPLALVDGRPLLLHSLDALAAAGAVSATVVTGHEAAAIEAVLGAAPIPARACFNARWADSPNGVSLLAAVGDVTPGTFLTMADHLLSATLARRLAAEASAPLALAVDRRLGHPWVDEADVTRVRTEGRQIRAIGKGLLVYDCYDTGLFLIGPELVAALAGLKSPGLSQGVAMLAAAGLAEAVDIGNASWLDVDDARALGIARAEWSAQCAVEKP